MMVGLATTYHDPDGRLQAQFERVLPRLTALFAETAVCASDMACGAVVTQWREAGALVREVAPVGKRPSQYLGSNRLQALSWLRETAVPFMFYCDADRIFHWADCYPEELAETVQRIQAYDFMVLGRTPRAFASHPHIQTETERLINEVFERVSRQPWDIAAAARGLSAAAVDHLRAHCSDETIGVDASWTLCLLEDGRFNLAYLETEGLEFETADRFGDDIARAGGLAAWQETLNNDPQQWLLRLDFAQTEIESMLPFPPYQTA